MNINDIVNAVFELGGAIVVWINAMKLYKDKKVVGVFWPVWIFYSVWGIWNLWYYPSLGQWFSVAAGSLLVVGNSVWCIMAGYYVMFKKNAGIVKDCGKCCRDDEICHVCSEDKNMFKPYSGK